MMGSQMLKALASLNSVCLYSGNCLSGDVRAAFSGRLLSGPEADKLCEWNRQSLRTKNDSSLCREGIR